MDIEAVSHMHYRSETSYRRLMSEVRAKKRALEAKESRSPSPPMRSPRNSMDRKYKRKWLKLVSAYHMDSAALDDQEALDLLIIKTALKFELSEDLVASILAECDKMKYPLVDIQKLTASMVPEPLRARLIKRAGKDAYISLLTRYYPMLQTDGLFLSIDHRLVEALCASSKLAVLEWYGSPLNHSTENYCSLFQEDVQYGAYPRIDEFIDFVDFPCRMLVNPPYTPAAIKVCIDKLLDYMKRQRGEFICLLPVMFNYEPMDRLLEYPGTHSRILEAGDYTLYSFVAGKPITATMKLQIIVNTAEDSLAMLDAIVDKMKDYALEVTLQARRERTKSAIHTKQYTRAPDDESWRRPRRVT